MATGSGDITLRRLAERYADEPDFKHSVDMVLGVFHIPRHPEGECEGCDAQREREAVDEPPTEQA
jgi:hypothetical protein